MSERMPKAVQLSAFSEEFEYPLSHHRVSLWPLLTHCLHTAATNGLQWIAEMRAGTEGVRDCKQAGPFYYLSYFSSGDIATEYVMWVKKLYTERESGQLEWSAIMMLLKELFSCSNSSLRNKNGTFLLMWEHNGKEDRKTVEDWHI